MPLPRQRQKKSRWNRQSHLHSRTSAARPRFRPQLEQLENRVLLNYDFGATSFQWVELLNNGLAVPNAFGVTGTGDDWANPVNLGSNTINFYGTTYSGPTALWASTNGLLTFGSGNSDFRPGDLLTNPGQAAIAPLWMDLYDNDPNHLMISAEIDSVNNRLIIEWDHVYDFVTRSNPITFEAIIQLNTGNTPGYIVFNYAQLDYFKGSAASIGIKDGGYQGPNDVVSLQTANPLVDNNQAILFSWQLPGPSIGSLSTNSASEGGSDLSFTVNGNNFTNSSVVEANGIALATSFTSNNQLQATLPASLLAEEGSLSITVLTPGPSGGTSNAAPFSVIDAPLTPSGQFVTATEGQTVTGGLVATFTDAGSDGTAADYSASVTWDDGNGQSHSSTGTVQLISGNMFGVYADNTVPYAEEGMYGVTVVISDVGGSQATVTSQVLVSDAPLTASGMTISATEGAAFAGAVATFSDANPNATLGDFTAAIDWGDGQTSPGTIAAGPNGSFLVSGSHTFADEGNFTVSVLIADAGAASTTATGSAVVADAALNAQGADISATEGSAFSGVVASFTDANATAAASEFTATILWGDGTSSPGAVTANGNGQFSVTGNHTYLEEGSFTIGVLVTDVGSASATASGSASVADAPLSASGTTLNLWTGQSFTGVVATFSDANPYGTASDYQASITWGDGTTSAGSIKADPHGGFDVVGSHAYSLAGTYAICVQIADAGGASATANSTAQVASVGLSASGTSVHTRTGITFTAVLANFSDTNPNFTTADFSAVINWGDGTTSAGTIASANTGSFSVIGTHTYVKEGAKHVTILIQDAAGITAQANSTVVAAHGDPTPQLQVHYQQLGSRVLLTGSLSDLVREDHKVLVNWGDGTTSILDLGVSKAAPFALKHNYTSQFLIKHHGRAQITVTLHAGTSSVLQVLNVKFNNHYGWKNNHGNVWEILGIDFFS